MLASLQNEGRNHEVCWGRIAINSLTQIWTLCVTSILIVLSVLSVLFHQCAHLVGRQDKHTGTIVENLLWGQVTSFCPFDTHYTGGNLTSATINLVKIP